MHILLFTLVVFIHYFKYWLLRCWSGPKCNQTNFIPTELHCMQNAFPFSFISNALEREREGGHL